jgi:hypothetical protein
MFVAHNYNLWMMMAVPGLLLLVLRTDVGTLAYSPTIAVVTPPASHPRTSLFVSTTTVSSMDEYDSQINSEAPPFESSQTRRRRVSPYSLPSQQPHIPNTPPSSLDLLELPRHTSINIPTETRTMSLLEVGLGRVAMVIAMFLVWNEYMTGQSFADQMISYGGGVWNWMISYM